MASLANDISEWLQNRPAWQQVVAYDLMAGTSYSEEDCQSLASLLASNHHFSRPSGTPETKQEAATPASKLTISEVEVIENINALVVGMQLTFSSEGITMVYGDNGSGKSGFARILKNALRSRQPEDVLTNVYDDDGTGQPKAKIVFECGLDARDECIWPLETSTELKQAIFFDRSCASSYVVHENEVQYRPRGLRILDELILICDKVRSILDEQLTSVSRVSPRLPSVDSNGVAMKFLTTLSSSTADSTIEEACILKEGTLDELASVQAELRQLRSVGVEGERLRLTTLSNTLNTVYEHIRRLDALMGADAISSLRQLESSALELRSTATRLAREAYGDDALPGTGSALWRALWEAAKTFSESEAYPDNSFPVLIADAKCVLCQQELRPDAQERFSQFVAVTTSHLEQEASAAEAEIEQRYTAIARTIISDHETGELLAQIDTLDDTMGNECREVLSRFREQQTALALRNANETDRHLTASTLSSKLELASGNVTARAEGIDELQYRGQLETLDAKCRSLQDQVAMSEARDALVEEVGRLRRLESLEKAKRQTATAQITAKATELTRKYVNQRIRDQFTAEVTPLGLRQVDLADIGGQKGHLRYRTRLRDTKQDAAIQCVLSEGEQSALGLAGLFVDIALDQSSSAVVLDDPISSLDHLKRAHVARRLTELASSRQVIIFTHDLVFLRDVMKACEDSGVSFAERTVQNLPSSGPGNCHVGFPWKAKDVKRRLGELKNALEVLEQRSSSLTAEAYEKEVADWAGKLSETFERMASQEVAERVYDQATLHVKPELFRIFGRITIEDNRVFQSVYSQASEWARRHDKSLAMNYSPPEL